MRRLGGGQRATERRTSTQIGGGSRPLTGDMKRYERTEFDDGTVIESYFVDNKLHREDGPASIERRPNGTVIEQWFRDGKLHRDNGPASNVRYAGGSAVEEWYRDDRLHREDGPAVITHRADGTVTEEWFHNGSPVRPRPPPTARRRPRAARPKKTNG